MTRCKFLPAAIALALTSTVSLAQPYQMGAGTEGRQWLPERVKVQNDPTRFPVTIQDDVTLTARDGILLDARLFRPR